MPDTVVDFWREISQTLVYKGVYCFEVGGHRCTRLWLNGETICMLFLDERPVEDGDKVIRCEKCRRYFGD